MALAIVAPSGRGIVSFKICRISKILSASSPYSNLLIFSRFELIIKFTLVKPLGISNKISLNSFIKGGRTKTIDARKITERIIITIKSANDLGILNRFLTLLHKLQIILAITSEQIISKKKFLKLQKIKKNILKIDILKKSDLFNLCGYFFSEYPKPLYLA